MLVGCRQLIAKGNGGWMVEAHLERPRAKLVAVAFHTEIDPLYKFLRKLVYLLADHGKFGNHGRSIVRRLLLTVKRCLDREERRLRQLALAQHIDHLVVSGQVESLADVARMCGVSRARVSQLAKLLGSTLFSQRTSAA